MRLVLLCICGLLYYLFICKRNNLYLHQYEQHGLCFYFLYLYLFTTIKAWVCRIQIIHPTLTRRFAISLANLGLVAHQEHLHKLLLSLLLGRERMNYCVQSKMSPIDSCFDLLLTLQKLLPCVRWWEAALRDEAMEFPSPKSCYRMRVGRTGSRVKWLRLSIELMVPSGEGEADRGLTRG